MIMASDLPGSQAELPSKGGPSRDLPCSFRASLPYSSTPPAIPVTKSIGEAYSAAFSGSGAGGASLISLGSEGTGAAVSPPVGSASEDVHRVCQVD